MICPRVHYLTLRKQFDIFILGNIEIRLSSETTSPLPPIFGKQFLPGVLPLDDKVQSLCLSKCLCQQSLLFSALFLLFNLCLDHTSYQSQPSQPAVAYLFQASVPFSTENTKWTAFRKVYSETKTQIQTSFVVKILDAPSQILNNRNTTSQCQRHQLRQKI